MLKISFRIWSVLILVFALSCGVFAKEIVIYHTNDVHSRVHETKDTIGYAKIATIVEESRKSKVPTLLLDAGDALHGTLFANLSKGKSIIDIMNMMKYDVGVVGNNDFNYGQDHLKELIKQAKFKVVSSNVAYDEQGKKLFITPYVIKMVGGIKVGILGVTTPETKEKSHPDAIKGLYFLNTISQTQKYVDILRKKEKVDVVIVLSHLGLDEVSVDRSDLLAHNVEGIDVIIDGHSYTKLYNGLMVNGVLIAQAGAYTNNLGMVTLNVEKGKVVSKTAKLINAEAAANVVPKPEVAEYIKKQDDIIQIENSKVIANTKVDWDGKREHVRTQPTNLGNLIATSMLYATKADLAIMNGGGIRSNIAKGDVTQGDIIRVLPFSNTLVVVKVKGSDVIAALENGLSAYPESLGGYPHVAGMKVKFDSSEPKGSRVVSVTLDNGSALNPEASYTVAINDLLKAGGDGYSIFKNAKVISEYHSLEAVFIDYFKSGKADEVNNMELNRIVDIKK